MDDNVMHIFGFVIKPIHVSVFYNFTTPFSC